MLNAVSPIWTGVFGSGTASARDACERHQRGGHHAAMPILFPWACASSTPFDKMNGTPTLRDSRPVSLAASCVHALVTAVSAGSCTTGHLFRKLQMIDDATNR